MSTAWSSRERLLAAIRHERPDRVPLWSLWAPDGQLIQFDGNLERTEKVLALGLDDSLRLEVPHRLPAPVRHDLLSELDYVSQGGGVGRPGRRHQSRLAGLAFGQPLFAFAQGVFHAGRPIAPDSQ